MDFPEYRIFVSEKVVKAIIELTDYLSNDLDMPLAADRGNDLIWDSIRSLRHFPKRHPVVEFEPWYSKGLHRLHIRIAHFLLHG